MDWSAYTPLYSDILGHFLGYLSEQSYREHGFMLSALAVAAGANRQSPPFFKWARELGALAETGEVAEDIFWAREVQKIQKHYRAQAVQAHDNPQP